MASYLCSSAPVLLLIIFIGSTAAASTGRKISWRQAKGRVNCTTDPKYLCGRVKSVHDGDSLRIIPETNDDGDRASVRVRLMQIDAPELSQAHGRDSRKALASRLPRGTRVCVISPGRDSYHRILGFVCLAKDDIAYRMLAEGHAWCYHNTCNLRYKAATSAARVAGLGLWTPGQTPMAPWAYRRFQRRRARKHRQQGKKE
ncbi:hypothetical protein BOX15_Mlig022653g4 [Macrostomum lignano]|uniref:TNase-like domain-containing protein n=1 Tax=Macrostomum lignano TaxID=282301 RepID=A0A267G401_9PLAT|nr:hypothetical protein BOX15_Mlig022653g2 [Macrostomum lignano]PAA80761.1 hypothetical protein BOX15_Mlig022653g4 [Macrostomum lignano]